MELDVYCVIGCPTFVLDAMGERRREWRRQPMRDEEGKAGEERSRTRSGRGRRRGAGRKSGGEVEKAASQTSGQGQGSPSLAIAYL